MIGRPAVQYGQPRSTAAVQGISALVLLALAATACTGLERVSGPSSVGPYRGDWLASEAEVAVYDGDLSSKDRTVDRGTFGDSFSFQGRAGESVRIELTSDVIDCYVYLYDDRGELLFEDDDSGGSLDSLAVAELPRDGYYRVVATSYSTEIGPYRLRVERGRLGARYLLLRPPAELSRDFASGVQYDDYGTPYHSYALELRAGAALEIAMRSADADSLLYLYDANGVQLASDDDSGGGFDALLTYVPPQAGRYYLVATTYQAPFGSAGYRLTVGQQP